jgi:hypothetical protein
MMKKMMMMNWVKEVKKKGKKRRMGQNALDLRNAIVKSKKKRTQTKAHA